GYGTSSLLMLPGWTSVGVATCAGAAGVPGGCANAALAARPRMTANERMRTKRPPRRLYGGARSAIAQRLAGWAGHGDGDVLHREQDPVVGVSAQDVGARRAEVRGGGGL